MIEKVIPYQDGSGKGKIILNSPITQSSLDALIQRYKDISKENNTSGTHEVPYDIDGSILEIDDGKIDDDYINSKFTKFLKVLRRETYSEKEIENALQNLHKSFASLSQEKQKFANMLIHDIESGDLIIDENKTFMDYITEYELNVENDQIKQLSIAFGLDENILRKMMSLSITEQNINEYGRFDDLLRTVDREKTRISLEKIYLKEIALWESNILVDKILRRFILQGGFDLKDINKEDRS